MAASPRLITTISPSAFQKTRRPAAITARRSSTYRRSRNPLQTFWIAVADLSFISLKIVLPSIKSLIKANRSELLVLVKPQFEVGKDLVGKGGVVRDHSLHAEAIKGVANESKKSGWYPKGLIASPLKGPAGNQEYLLWMGDKNEENIEIEKLLNVLFF